MEPHAEPDERQEELPEHEIRDEGPTGAGLTSSGITAPQPGPRDESMLEAEDDEEPEMNPNEPPPAYRPPTG